MDISCPILVLNNKMASMVIVYEVFRNAGYLEIPVYRGHVLYGV